MKAMLLDTQEKIERGPLTLCHLEAPTPAPTEIRVRVQACAVCRTDLHVVEGDLPMRVLPVIPGHQVVGTVDLAGSEVTRFGQGDRVGVSWLHRTCGTCSFCTDPADRENLCESADFTGWSVNGGYAEFVVVPQAFAYKIPGGFASEQASPLLCAGVIGYRALKLSGVQPGQRLGLYGFGASAHIAIQIARHWGCKTYVYTRSERNRRLARELGADHVSAPGDSGDDGGAALNAALVFAPAGPVVLEALKNLAPGGTVALAGIYMTPIPDLDYTVHLYKERVLRSVANATRRDAQELLDLAAAMPLQTKVTLFPLDRANQALLALKTGRLSGAAVLECG